MKKCVNGHYYADELEQCPYCPPGTPNVPVGQDDNLDSSGSDKTEVFGGTKSDGEEKTNVFPDSGKSNNGGFTSSDPDGTIISVPSDSSGKHEKRARKKLVGWLVSYTIDEMGMDFRLYEGKNVIGTKPGCNITVLNDRSVSSEHATILFRGGVFMIKDEFSTNGTYLNDKMLVNETPVLKDGDIIKTGDTEFKFKSAL